MVRLIGSSLIAAALAITGCRLPNNPPPGEGTATFYVHIITNAGGPSMKSLEGALVYIEDANGKFVTAASSDAGGNFMLRLPGDTYTIDPQPVPGTDFYTPPERYQVALKGSQEQRDTLYYSNPMN